MSVHIRWLTTTELPLIAPFLQQLSACGTTHPGVIEHLQSLPYQVAGLFVNQQLTGICGVWPLYKHYVGKHLELDNVAVLPSFQGQQLGQQLVQWVIAWARQNKYQAIELNCYLANKQGLKFWENQGFKPLGVHMQQLL